MAYRKTAVTPVHSYWSYCSLALCHRYRIHCIGILTTLRLRQNWHHFADGIFKCIFLIENIWISITISLKFVSKGRINNIPALVQIMVWCSGDKPFIEPMMVRLPTHICVTRLQWFKTLRSEQNGTHFVDVILKLHFLHWLVIWFRFKCCLFLRIQLTTTQHWFR